MTETITLAAYRRLTYSLRRIEPLKECCGNAVLEPVHIEPLEGRDKSQVKRTCIVQCPECKRKYVSDWD
jgi:hypothetical protein